MARGSIAGRHFTITDMKRYQVMTRDEAEAGGYVSITTPYKESSQQDLIWMGRVLDDMRGCDAVVIDLGDSYEVARHGSELKFDR